MDYKIINNTIREFTEGLDICDECYKIINKELEKREKYKNAFDSSTLEEQKERDREKEKIIKKSDLGIRSDDSITNQLIRENVIMSNIVSDIKNVNYTEGNFKRTALKKLDDLPPFIDDIYGWGYFSESQGVKKGKKIYFRFFYERYKRYYNKRITRMHSASF